MDPESTTSSLYILKETKNEILSCRVSKKNTMAQDDYAGDYDQMQAVGDQMRGCHNPRRVGRIGCQSRRPMAFFLPDYSFDSVEKIQHKVLVDARQEQATERVN